MTCTQRLTAQRHLPRFDLHSLVTAYCALVAGGMVNRRTGIHVLSVWLIAQGLSVSLLAAEPQQEQDSDKELGEILVEGRKPEKNPQKVIDWMARLVGEFTFEGEVDLQAKGRPQDLHPVRGSGNCIGFGPAPAVQCEINVHWTPVPYEERGTVLGGVSNLEPAMMLFGFEPDRFGIRYMLVDSEGIAEGALGYVVGRHAHFTLAVRERPGPMRAGGAHHCRERPEAGRHEDRPGDRLQAGGALSLRDAPCAGVEGRGDGGAEGDRGAGSEVRHIVSIWIMLVACAAVFADGVANAQGRGPAAQELREFAQGKGQKRALDPAVRGAKLAELDVWLRRLIGRFSIEGIVKVLEATGAGCLGGICNVVEGAKGTGDCIGISTGPGVHCVINVPWPRFFSTRTVGRNAELKWRGPYLEPAMILFGIDPKDLEIRLLLVDGQSRAVEALGSLRGDSVTFRYLCSSGRVATTCPIFHLRASPGAMYIEMEYENYEGSSGNSVAPLAEFRFVLQRDAQTPEGEVP